MIGTEDLLSVQDATELSQGKNSKQTTKPSNTLISPPLMNLSRQNQRKAAQTKFSTPSAKLRKKLIVDDEREEKVEDENKENISPNITPLSSESKRRSKRLAGEDLTPAEKEFCLGNYNHTKEPENLPPIKYANRFEKAPDVISIVITPLKDKEEKKETAILKENLLNDFKGLKNYKDNAHLNVVSQKINDVRVCEDEAGTVLPKMFSVKMKCCKAIIFAKEVLAEQHRKRFGKVIFDKNAMQNRVEKVTAAITALKSKLKPDEKLKKVIVDKVSIILPPEVPTKKFYRVAITREILKIWKYKAQEGRSPQQGSKMGMSAGEYVKLYGFEDPENKDRKSNWEWLHLMAFSLGGPNGSKENKPQCKANLVAGTAGANTWMMLAEDIVRYLLSVNSKEKEDGKYKKLVDTVFVTVEAELFPGTHIAKRIDYTIHWTRIGSVQEKSMTFKFDPLRYDAPPKVLEDDLRRLVDRELEHQHDNEIILDEETSQNNVDLDYVNEYLDVDINNNNVTADVTNDDVIDEQLVTASIVNPAI